MLHNTSATIPGCWATSRTTSLKRNSKQRQREFYEQFARKIRRAGLIRHHQVWTVSYGIKLYKDSFKGEDFAVWLMCSQSWGRTEALNAGQRLMDHRLIEPIGWTGEKGTIAQTPNNNQTPPVDPKNNFAFPLPQHFSGMPNPGHFALAGRSFSADRFYRLIDDEDHKVPLNELGDEENDDDDDAFEENGGDENGTASSAGSNSCGATKLCRGNNIVSVREFNARLCTVLDQMYALVLSEDRRCVHLDLLDDCETFEDYRQLSLEANFVDVAGASVPERLAFFINMHNAMIVHITHKFGLPGTIWQRRKYLYSTYYNLGGHLYSLQSIFNGILRGNRRGLDMLWKPFGDQDHRNQFLIQGGESLVHFGLNNYTRSTPPIRTYSTEHVYEELRANANECLASKEFLQIESKTGQIRLAKVFKQYADDFGATIEDVLCWIVRTMDHESEERARLVKLISTRHYTLSYLPTDSDLNMTYGLNSLVAKEDEQQLANNGHHSNGIIQQKSMVRGMSEIGEDGGGGLNDDI